jgi:Periplasmic component of the Tol biopolymer transport system
VFYDRSGKRMGGLGERALYGETVLSPDRSRVAVVIQDLANESADLFVLDAASGAKTRLTTSARTEFVMAPVWSPDGRRIAYVTIRKGRRAFTCVPPAARDPKNCSTGIRRVHESLGLVVGRPVPELRDLRSQRRDAVRAAARRRPRPHAGRGLS